MMRRICVIMVSAVVISLAVGCASQQKRSSVGDFAQEESRNILDTKLQTVFFDFDKYDLRPDARRILNEHISFLKKNKKTNIQIEGHCDERGTEEYNIALGERRAISIKEFLISKGVSAQRITFISYGEERPTDPRHNETAWAMNRRGEFVLYRK